MSQKFKEFNRPIGVGSGIRTGALQVVGKEYMGDAFLDKEIFVSTQKDLNAVCWQLILWILQPRRRVLKIQSFEKSMSNCPSGGYLWCSKRKYGEPMWMLGLSKGTRQASFFCLIFCLKSVLWEPALVRT